MQRNLLNLVSFLVVSITLLTVTPVIQFIFADKVLNEYFSGSFNMYSILEWLFCITILFCFGLTLSIFVKSNSLLWWVISLGATYSIFLAIFSRTYFPEPTSFATYFWVYGLYFTPIIGSILGFKFYKVAFRPKVGT